MNLSFHRPKKDMCGLCLTYMRGDEIKKQQLEEKYNQHIAEKKAVHEKKQRAKGMLDDITYRTTAAVFDLQQVILPTCMQR